MAQQAGDRLVDGAAVSKPTVAQRLDGVRERKNRRIARLRARVAELEEHVVKLSLAADRVFADPERPYRPEALEADRALLELSEASYELVGSARFDEIEARL